MYAHVSDAGNYSRNFGLKFASRGLAIGAVTWDSVVAGGLFLLAAIPTIGIWLWRRYGAFEIRFLADDVPIEAEGMRTSTIGEIPIGKSAVRFHIRPRFTGADVRYLNFAFFNNPFYPRRLLPRAHGKRRKLSEIKVGSLKTLNSDGSWEPLSGSPRQEESMTFQMHHELFPGSRRVYELEFDTKDAMQGWNGIFGFQLQYQPGLYLARRDIHTKVFVGPRRRWRPFTFWGRQLQRARLVEKPSSTEQNALGDGKGK